MNTRFTATLTAIALAGLAAQSSVHASDREWAIAGKVLTGIAAAHVISHAIQPRPRVVYHSAPAPVVYHSAPTRVVVHAAPLAPAAPVCYPARARYVASTTAVAYHPAPHLVYVAAPAPVYHFPAPHDRTPVRPSFPSAPLFFPLVSAGGLRV